MSKVADEFRRLSEQTLAKLKKEREALDYNIAIVEQSLNEPPYESNLDYEAIQFEAEYTIVFLDLCEQKRSK